VRVLSKLALEKVLDGKLRAVIWGIRGNKKRDKTVDWFYPAVIIELAKNSVLFLGWLI